jgi:hypothetical protein
LKRNEYSLTALSPREFVLVIAMLETSDFFQVQIKIQTRKCRIQIKKCESLAARAIDKSEREFWVQLAHRWEDLLRARQRSGFSPESGTDAESTDAEIVRSNFATRPAA